MPDEEDLEIRAALAQSPAVRIVYLTDIIVESGLQFSRQEIEAFANCFMLAPLSVEPVKNDRKSR